MGFTFGPLIRTLFNIGAGRGVLWCLCVKGYKDTISPDAQCCGDFNEGLEQVPQYHQFICL